MNRKHVNPLSENIMRKQQARCLFSIQLEAPGEAFNAPAVSRFHYEPSTDATLVVYRSAEATPRLS